MSIQHLYNMPSGNHQCFKCDTNFPSTAMIHKFIWHGDPQAYRYFCISCLNKCLICGCKFTALTGNFHILYDSIRSNNGPVLQACKDCCEGSMYLKDYTYTDIYTGIFKIQDKRTLKQKMQEIIKDEEFMNFFKELINEEIYKPEGLGAELAKQDFEKKAEKTNEGL